MVLRYFDGLAAGDYLVFVDTEDVIIPSKVITITKGERTCTLVEQPTVRVQFTPSITRFPLQFKVIDHAGLIVRDDQLRGRGISGGGPALSLPVGRYTVEVISSKITPYVAQIEVQEDSEISMELELSGQ